MNQRLFIALLFYMLEILLAMCMIGHHFKKREKLVGRGGISIGGLLICCAMLSYTPLLGAQVWMMVLVYVTAFFIAVLAAYSWVKEPFWNVLFCGVAAYAMQNMRSKICTIITNFIWEEGRWPAFWMECIYWILAAAVLFALVYRFLIRKDAYEWEEEINKKHALGLCAVTLIIVVILSSISDVYFAESRHLAMVSYLYSIIACIFILLVHSGLLSMITMNHELKIVHELWEKDRSQYEMSKANVEIINEKCHDLKYQIRALRCSDEKVTREALKEIEDVIQIYDASIKTGNDSLDVILTEKTLYCQKNGIRMTYMVDGEKLNFMSASDLCILFGNALDNAIEAVMKLENVDKRVISIVVTQKQEFVLLQVENYYDGVIRMDNGIPVTTKGDMEYHGFGVKSIRMIAEKYEGLVSILTTEDTYRLSISWPV